MIQIISRFEVVEPMTLFRLLPYSLKESKLYNYARIETLTFLGISYLKCENKKMAEFYFNQIISNIKRYESEPISISQFLKEIAEYCYVISDFINCLYYYELGFELNPKLAVKKRIAELKNRMIK